jgi:hypothetical protein
LVGKWEVETLLVEVDQKVEVVIIVSQRESEEGDKLSKLTSKNKNGH